MINLFFYSLLVQMISIIFIIIFKNNRKASAICHLLLISGLILGLVSVVARLFFYSSDNPGFYMPGIPDRIFRFDTLSLYFLGTMTLVAIPTTIHSFSYFKHYADEDKPVRRSMTLP